MYDVPYPVISLKFHYAADYSIGSAGTGSWKGDCNKFKSANQLVDEAKQTMNAELPENSSAEHIFIHQLAKSYVLKFHFYFSSTFYWD